MNIDFNKILEQYGLIGVIILLLPYFVKSAAPTIRDIFNFVFDINKIRSASKEKLISGQKAREEVVAQAELQAQKSRLEHDQWVYKNAYSVLQENLAWIRQQFVVVQKNEDESLKELQRELSIINGQLKMLTRAVQQMQTNIVLMHGGEHPFTMETWGADEHKEE